MTVTQSLVPSDIQIKQGQDLLRNLRTTYPFRYGKAVLLWTGDVDLPYGGWTVFTSRQGARQAAKRRGYVMAYILAD